MESGPVPLLSGLLAITPVPQNLSFTHHNLEASGGLGQMSHSLRGGFLPSSREGLDDSDVDVFPREPEPEMLTESAFLGQPDDLGGTGRNRTGRGHLDLGDEGGQERGRRNML